MMERVWEEHRAHLTLEMLNKRIAACFNQQPRDVTFLFVPVIERHQVLHEGQLITTRETTGDCNRATGVIRIVPIKGWQQTAVHELTHLYNPGRREATICKLTRDAIRYLKNPMLWGTP